MTDEAFLAADAADRRAALAAAVDLASHREDVYVRDGDEDGDEDGDAQYVPPGHIHWLSLADSAYDWLRKRNGEPVPTPADLAVISGQLTDVNTKLEKIMSEDAAVQAVTADVLTDVQGITTALTGVQAAFAALQQEIASGTTTVQPATLSALQAAQAQLDAVTGTASSDASADAAAAPTASSTPATPAT